MSEERMDRARAKPSLGIEDLKTDEEIAEFWETHKVTDYEDRLELVTEPLFGKRKTTTLHIRVDEGLQKQLKVIAEGKGVGYSDLVRSWIIEKLRDELKEIKAT